MSASPLRFFRAGPPPQKVALLPDAMFFTRAVAVTAGATPAEAAGQVELALEAVSPFPLSQLYYAWYWLPGSERALVFAAYRRRFTSDQVAAWEGSELVLPAFAAVLGATVEPATTILLTAADGLTAVHWETAGVPARVLFAALPAEPTDDDRARARDHLLRAIGGSKNVVELVSPLAVESSLRDGEVAFRSGDFIARLAAPVSTAMDVRDKAELAAIRAARRRDVFLWRVALGSAAALLLLGVAELALVGGRQWQRVRTREIAAQKPLVDKITAQHELANRIDEITTKRLLPIEMVIASAGAKPDDITFTQAVADRSRGLHTLIVQGTTANAGQINAYEAALRAQPGVESAVASIQQMQNDRTRFQLTVVFKPEALKPMQAQPANTAAK